MVELANKHSTEEIAESLYNTFARASCLAESREDVQPPFDHLSLEEQQWFFVLAREGPAVLQQLEHQPLSEVARQLYTEAGPARFGAPAYGDLKPVQHLVWEMAARQMAILIDCDEADTLADVEATVLSWLARKMALTQH